MVDISGIGQNLGLSDAAKTAGTAAGVANAPKTVRKRPLASDKGLGLEDIPDDIPSVPVEAAEVEDTSAPAAAENVAGTDFDDAENDAALARIDYELASVQVLLKKVLFKKVALADEKHSDRTLQHRLLVNVAEHCKDAYTKLKEVRNLLS